LFFNVMAHLVGRRRSQRCRVRCRCRFRCGDIFKGIRLMWSLRLRVSGSQWIMAFCLFECGFCYFFVSFLFLFFFFFERESI